MTWLDHVRGWLFRRQRTTRPTPTGTTPSGRGLIY